jgi:cytosine/adenosine deaminase-related metal-dependent hydrolase
MRKAGINVALGADGAPCNNNLDIFQEMRLAALIHKPGAGPKAMRAQEVMDMATRDGAKALGWQDDIGSIEVGKKADLVALDLDTPTNTVRSFTRPGRPRSAGRWSTDAPSTATDASSRSPPRA